MKPIHKLNNGRGVTLCNECSVIITEGITDDILCNKCNKKVMTYTEQYNKYVQEWVKENPAFSGPHYENMLEFDEWIDKYMVEFVEWVLSRSLGETVQLKDDTLAKYKKEKGLLNKQL